MKMFVWESVGGLTCNYHDGGGVLVIAEDLERARKVLLNTDGISIHCEALDDVPDFSASVDCQEEKVMTFPDAGCC